MDVREWHFVGVIALCALMSAFSDSAANTEHHLNLKRAKAGV
jgi:hypothetical protein